ncbi:MAG TPA: selenide, water dikinase SelD, partial [Thermoleophilaceae bacterium]
MPGALAIDRNVLEWRLDPSSPDRIPNLRECQQVVLVCNEGYQSSLAAAGLRDLGIDATDLIGGFQAWRGFQEQRRLKRRRMHGAIESPEARSTRSTAPLERLPSTDIALTSLSRGAGCGCKLSAAAIGPLVRDLSEDADPRLLVGSETADDAGVVLVAPDLALVQTVDFFTPIVDDPYDFGRIAAANALSDVYAMGGRPLSALNLVAFPLEQLGPEVLAEVLRGGADVTRAAGALLVGGHSIDDPEPKYGLAVTGTVDPAAVLTNAGGRAGDALVLTKPLGAGAVSTAVKRGLPAPL